MCLLKLSTGLFRRSEEKGNSCELRYYFVNYVTISSRSTTVNSDTVAKKIIYETSKTHFLTYIHAKHFQH